MKLVRFTVSNYRSIMKAYKLPLQEFTVLVGPNNEGKSNVLQGLVCAMSVLSAAPRTLARRGRSGPVFVRGLPRYPYRTVGRYDWERDYPVSLQQDKPDGNSSFVLEFELTPEEQSQFNSSLGLNLHTNLKLKLEMGKTGIRYEPTIQGPGKKALRDKVEGIAEFIAARITCQYIPSIRPSEVTVEIVESMIADALSELEQDASYQKLIKSIAEKQKPTLDGIADELTKSVRDFIPDVSSIKLEAEDRIHRAVRRSCRVIVDDGRATDLEQKGDGVKSLVAISLMRYFTQRARKGRHLVLAVEEPESHLHPGAVHRLRQVLHDMAAGHQVIITTHSPLLVHRARAGQNIVVGNGKASKASGLPQIRDVLGVRLSDNLSSAGLVLLVEGESDIRMATTWLRAKSTALAKALDNGFLTIDHLGGGSNLSYKAGFFQNAVCNVHAFMDNDATGKGAVQKALDNRILTDADYHLAKKQGLQESEIEDLIPEAAYAQELKEHYGLSTLACRPEKRKRAWSERMKDCFESQGKLWNDQVESQTKGIVANLVQQDSVLPDQHGDQPVAALVSALEDKLRAYGD